ncbi:MAG TPA: peptidoglycan DD-metalloendopeptidase family protein [Candidatus Limnocylindrales bacterium]|nr:peptidoglycan DD-metalloendopeptidase family protein [Candidatus Limnocylindrales bacterium]
MHAVVVICAFTLLTAAFGTRDAMAATQLGSQISSGRRSQSYFESVMLAADATIAGIKAQARITRRGLKQAKRAITHAKRAHRVTTAIVQQRSARLAELEARYAGVPPEGIPAGFPDRLRSVRRDLARAKAHRQDVGRSYRAALRAEVARQHRLNLLTRSLPGAVARRESAEGGLGAYIVQLTRLAELRAENQSDVQLSTSSAGFTWPSVGRIAQTYGCTGFYLNPPRGSCRHFHDGLDIVSGYGSRVHSAADGVVAYAGWNPWDEGGRAWIMVVSHPDGYVTRYGHLIPGSLARVGQFVSQGQAIGKMGNTGNSLGTHLHFELLSGGTAVDPWAYLPAGMVTMKPAKHAGKHVGGKHRRGAQAAKRKHQAARRRADSRSASEQGGFWVTEAAGAFDGQVPHVSLGTVPLTQSLGDSDADVCRPPAKRPDGQRHRTGTGAKEGKRTSRDRGPGADRPASVEGSCPGSRAAGSAGAPVEGSSGRRLPDTAETMGQDSGVSLPRRGTSPIPA